MSQVPSNPTEVSPSSLVVQAVIDNNSVSVRNRSKFFMSFYGVEFTVKVTKNDRGRKFLKIVWSIKKEF
jgi:P pilus assembly chaperone PapD